MHQLPLFSPSLTLEHVDDNVAQEVFTHIEKDSNWVRYSLLTTDSVFNSDEKIRGSARLRTFKNNCKCVSCGRKGNVFVEESPVKEVQQSRHFNLYSVTKQSMVLMTVDHILPKSLGGGNVESNYQTMCANCNNKKKQVMSREEIERVRADVDKHVKPWVNKQYLDLLLEFQLVIDGKKGHERKKLLGILSSYAQRAKTTTTEQAYQRSMKTLELEITRYTNAACNTKVKQSVPITFVDVLGSIYYYLFGKRIA